MSSRQRRRRKELSIRVIGLLDGTADAAGGAAPHGSVLQLTLDELLQSRFTDEYADASQPLWVQIENASHRQLSRIGEHFGLHPLTVEALQTRHTREKLEIFANYLFLVFDALHGGRHGHKQVSMGQQPDWAGFQASGAARQEHYQRAAPQLNLFSALRNQQPDPATLDPLDISRDQAEAMAISTSPARSPGPMMPRSRDEPVHEGSSLLNNQATMRYYGGSTLIEPSPVPPRRHKSALSMNTLQQRPNATPSPRYPGGSSGGQTPQRAVSASPVAGDPSSASLVPASAIVPLPPIPRVVSDRHFRMFPDQTLMPGSPQSPASRSSSRSSSSSSESEDDEDESATDSEESESESDSDSARSSSSSSNASSCSNSRRSSRSNSLCQGSRSVSPTESFGESPRSSARRSTGQVVRALRQEVSEAVEEGRASIAAPSSRKKPPPARSSRKRNGDVPTISTHTAATLLSDRAPLRTAPIKLVVFPHMVLSFHSSELATVTSVARRLERVYRSSVESTAWIIHALLDSITDSLLPVVNATATEVDALEELIFVLSGSEHRDLLKRMGMTRRRLSFLRQRLWSKRDILMSLIGKDWQVFANINLQIPYLRDVYDHVVTLLHRVEAASDMLASLQNTYLANVQIDVAEAGNESNLVMKNLTAVGAIILPLQLVASLWGMNCQVPFQAFLDWSDSEAIVPFISVCAAMLLVTLFMSAYFKKHDLM